MVQKVKEVLSTKWFTWFMLVGGAMALLYYYGKRIPYINGVWELVDEYGYLVNAAYMSGTEWEYVTNSYYGYGYSILLIPLFWLCNTGIEIIRGAIWINVMCVVALFFVQYLLLSKLVKDINKNIIVAISFVLCLYPYIVASTLKVTQESLLTLLIWVCGLLFYQAYTTQKWYWHTLLGVCVAYIFFVHTRAFIFCAAVFLIVAVMLLMKKSGIKELCAFIIPCVLLLAIGSIWKQHLIDAVYSNVLFESAESVVEGAPVAVANTLTVEYILKKILGTFTDFSVWHLYSFACKNFYLLVATAGLFHIGIFQIVKDCISNLKQKKEVQIADAIRYMYVIAVSVMIMALIVQTPGRLDKSTYFYYGRYFEYLIGPVTALGAIYVTKEKLHVKWLCVLLGLVLCFGGAAFDLSKHLETQGFYYDANRIASLSMMVNKTDVYAGVIKLAICFALVLVVLVFISSNIKYMRVGVVLVLFIACFLNGRIVAGNTVLIHARNTDEYIITNHIHENYEVEEVWFLNGDEVQTTVYSAIQSLLGKEKLNLIEAKDLGLVEKGDLIITFYHNPYMEQMELPYRELTEAGSYELFVVE